MPLATIDEQAAALAARLRRASADAAGGGAMRSCGRCAASTWRGSSRRCAPRVAMLQGKKHDVRRGVAGALRRGGADAHRGGLRGRARSSSTRSCPGSGTLIERYDAFQHGIRHPAEPARSRVQGGDSRLPRAHAAARRRCRRARRFTVEYVTDKIVERLQLVPGQLPQPDPGEHRSADLHRSRDRSGVPRGLSRPSRLQRAAREDTWCAIAAGSSSPSIRCSRRSR